MSQTEFVPIRITGCDEDKVRRGSQSKNQYLFPFSLSAKPPKGWEEIFDDLWRAHRKKGGSTKASAYVHKSLLMLECPIKELAAQYGNLRITVQSANEKYAGQLQDRAKKEAKKQRKREEDGAEERAAIHEALQSLDFS